MGAHVRYAALRHPALWWWRDRTPVPVEPQELVADCQQNPKKLGENDDLDFASCQVDGTPVAVAGVDLQPVDLADNKVGFGVRRARVALVAVADTPPHGRHTGGNCISRVWSSRQD